MASGIKHLLECNVCSNAFNDKERVPKGLPCQHTFCLACLKRIKTHGFHTGDDGSVSIRVLIKCPECGQRFLAPGENVNNFPNNLTMISLIGAMKKTVALRPTPDADLRSCLTDRVQRLRDEIAESAEMLVGNLSGLEKQVKTAKTSITNAFDRLRDEIDRREENLLDEVDDFMARKESIVKHPTEGMAKQLQEMEKFCNEMDRRAKVKRDSRLPTYIDHCLDLIEKLEHEKRHPKWEASFQPSNIDALRTSLSKFGKLNLFAPESDESEFEDDDHRLSSGSSLASRPRHSSPYSISPTPSENHNGDNDRHSPWSLLSTSGSYTDDTADEAVGSSQKYRQERPVVRTRDRNPKSPTNQRRRRITAIQSSLEFEQKYGGVPQLVEPPNSRLLAIAAPTTSNSSSKTSRSSEHSRPHSHSRSSREYHTVQLGESNVRSSQQIVRASEMLRASQFSHDSFDYEVPDFDSIPQPASARRNTVERVTTVSKPEAVNVKSQQGDKDEIYSQPFDSEAPLTDDDKEEGDYVGAGLGWPPIPRNKNAGNLPEGFELFHKPYLGRQDTLTSMDSYVEMDLQNNPLGFSKSDCESTDVDPLEVLENLDMTQEQDEPPITATNASTTYSEIPNKEQYTHETLPLTLVKEGCQKYHKRSPSNINNHTNLAERKSSMDPVARRKAFIESHNSDFIDISSTKSLYEDVAVPTGASSTLPVESVDYTDTIPSSLNNSLRKLSKGSDIITSESEQSEQSRSNSRVVSRTVSIELPDISSLSFNVGKLNGDSDIPTEIPPIMDAPSVQVGAPMFANVPIVIMSNSQDPASKIRPSSWSPRVKSPNSPGHHITVNGAIYTDVRRSSWSPLSIREIEEYEHSLSVSEWTSEESSSEDEDPYEVMSWSMPCGLNRIGKVDNNNKLKKECVVDKSKLSANFKRKSHPAYSETCTSADEIQAQPRPRSYALSRQINNDKGESQIYWFPPRRLSRKRNSRRHVYKLSDASGESMTTSIDGQSEPARSRVPPRVAKKPSVGPKTSNL